MKRGVVIASVAAIATTGLVFQANPQVTSPIGPGTPLSLVGPMVNVVAASREMPERVARLEERRADAVAAFPRGPYHLNIAGVQNLRPLDTFYSSSRVQ